MSMSPLSMPASNLSFREVVIAASPAATSPAVPRTASGGGVAGNGGPGSGPRRGRSIVFGVLAVLSVVGIASAPLACSSGGVGDPCTPEDEYDAEFPGFTVDLDNIESNSFQCATRICLVNHFQGRVSCPLGQAQPAQCNPANKGSDCTGGKSCVLSETFAPSCTACAAGTTDTCTAIGCPDGLTCTVPGGGEGTGSCLCTQGGTVNGVQYYCEPSVANQPTSSSVLHSYVCHTPATTTASDCQDPTLGAVLKNEVNGVPKDCCVPGTDSPVSVAVCGQCAAHTQRDAADSVYCSCRCCAPCCTDMTLSLTAASAQGCSLDVSTCGPACDPNFNYCTCPGGFSCTNISPNIGLGNAELAGAYCVKSGTAYTGQTSSCDTVVGVVGTGCIGLPSNPTN